eukprot:jgi/Mesvir1/2820/Mv13917-RA.1
MRSIWVCLWTLSLVSVALGQAPGRPPIDPQHNHPFSNPSGPDYGMAELQALRQALVEMIRIPPGSEKLLLFGLGESLVVTGQWECNPFGPCIAIPPSSNLALTCPDIASVDCAFHSEAMAELRAKPTDVVDATMAKKGFPACPACQLSQKKLWCGQLAPTCGTFDKVVDLFVPVLASLLQGGPGVDPVQAVVDVVPQVLNALALGLPCRAMCSAVTATCGCGRSPTFGKVMEYIQETAAQEVAQAEEALPPGDPRRPPPGMSVEVTRRLFAKVWSTPLCELFAEPSAKGFHGPCTGANGTGATGSSAGSGHPTVCSWCNDPNAYLEAERLTVQGLADAVASILFSGLGELVESANFDPRFYDRDVAARAQPQGRGGGHSAGAVVGIVFLVLLLVGAGGAMLAWYVRQKRMMGMPSYISMQDDMGGEGTKYQPPSV